MKKTIFIILIMVIALMPLLAGSTKPTNSAETSQTAATDAALAEINRQVGMPDITNYQQKKLMKMIYEQCDKENLLCYAYLKADYTGRPVFLTKCIGYGVPFSAQYTNPDKVVDDPWRYQSGGKVVSQADPNGLYMPTSSSATWLLAVDPKTNKSRLAYIEPEILVFPFPIPGIPLK